MRKRKEDQKTVEQRASSQKQSDLGEGVQKAALVRFKIDIPIFNAVVIACFGDYDAVNPMLRKQYDVEIDEALIPRDADGFVVNLDTQCGLQGSILLVMDDFSGRYSKNPIGFTGVINHEILHAVVEIMKIRGIPVIYENDEIMAYLQEFIFEEIMNKLVNFRNKSKHSRNK